ncbi:MAG TPA: glycosyltransferase family 9 protein [Gemmatimonadaceae bacterium]|nr:glycosyltransferase family 9 protein [Gemmatimonadaceae bacterium]
MRGTPTAEQPAVRRQPVTEPPPVTEQLVLQTSFLGDTVLTTPLIAELAMRGPVDVLTTPAAAPLLANSPHIRTVHVYDKRGADAGASGLHHVAQRLRDGVRARGAAHRICYLAQGSLRSGALAAMAGYDERVGFHDAAGRMFYTQRVLRREDRHHAERLWRLAFPSNPGVEPPEGALRPHLYPGAAEREAVDALLAPLDGAPFVALAPGSVWATKRWPYYSKLAAELAPRIPLVVVGGADDAELARAIAGAAPPGRTLDATGRLSLLASAELIGRARAIVTNDSSPQHLASAMGTPTVTIFGPTVPAFGFGPLAPGSREAELTKLECRPCHHHGPPTCPLGHWRCMNDLNPGYVAAMVEQILKEG